MKHLLTCLLAMLGLTSACGQKNYEDVDVKQFAEIIADTSVVVLDVRTADEFAEGHIARAVNIDVKQSDFMDKAKTTLSRPKGSRPTTLKAASLHGIVLTSNRRLPSAIITQSD